MDCKYNILEDNTLEIISLDMCGDNLIVPSEIDSKKVSKINLNYTNKKINLSIYFDGDLKQWCEMSVNDFLICRKSLSLYIDGNLVEGDLVVPEGTREIGDGAFDECNDIATITIPKSVKRIGDRSFLGCRNLKRVYFEDGSQLEEIGRWAFEGCHRLKNIIIPNGVKIIGQGAFKTCFDLDVVILPNDLITIGKMAFANCSRLKDIYIPSNVEEMKEGAFAYSALNNITFGNMERIKSIENYCFWESKLHKITLPKIVDNLGKERVFPVCLREITVPQNLHQINTIFSTNIYLEKIIFDNDCSIRYFNKKSFLDLNKLEIVITGNKITRGMAIAFIEHGIKYKNPNMIQEKFLDILTKKDLEKFIYNLKDDCLVSSLAMIVGYYSKKYPSNGMSL